MKIHRSRPRRGSPTSGRYSVRSVFERFADGVRCAWRRPTTPWRGVTPRRRRATSRAIVRRAQGPCRDARAGSANSGCRCGGRSTPIRATPAELRSRILRARSDPQADRADVPDGACDPEERERRQILIAIETLVDFESWAHMRQHKGLSFAEACAVDPRDRPAAAADAGFLTLRPGKRRKARFVGSDPRWRP